jgi:DNA mismatch repair ATPase MutS
MQKNVDLLYPNDESRDYRLSEFSFIDELDLYNILGINRNNLDLTEYFTNSKEVIEYRNNILSDFIGNNCLSSLEKIIRIFAEIREIREHKKQSTELIAMLHTIFEIEVYVNLISYLNEFFKEYNFTSAALSNLKTYASNISASETYASLSENLKKFRLTVDNVQSVTIGVNLSPDLKPYEAGVISLNTSKYRSGNLFDRILSLDTKDDGYRCLAPLSPVKGDISGHQSLIMAFNYALESIIKDNIKSWQPLISKYFADNTDYFMSIGQDIQFYIILIKYFNKCRFSNLNITKPNITDGGVYYKDIYNINVALHSEKIIYNDVEFDGDGQIYILTGPNQGGKSVFLKAVGINQALFQLGGYVNASEASLKISPNIIVYLTKNNERSIGFGHLGEECSAVADLLKHIKNNCLFLFDEAFSSTSASDQCYIAGEVLTALSKLGCYGVFVTHNYDIYDKMQEINGIGSLVALMSGEESAERSYKIVRKEPDRNSFAADIMRKYNLQCGDILNNAGG